MTDPSQTWPNRVRTVPSRASHRSRWSTERGKAVDAVNPRWRRLYTALLPGALAYLETIEPGAQIAQTRDAIAMVGNLPVKINPHFGLRYDDGRAEAVRLHLDEQPPTEELVLATLHLMARHIDQVLPHATPVLVDLRRGTVHRPTPPAPAAHAPPGKPPPDPTRARRPRPTRQAAA